MGNVLRSLRGQPGIANQNDIEENGLLLEQYASQVLDFSTQYGSDRSFSYTAANCLGVPSKFPNYGDFPQTFVTRSYGQWNDKSPGGRLSLKIRNSTVKSQKGRYKEFIDVRFEHQVFVHGIFIYETLNPGSIVALFAGDCKGKWKCLWSGETSKIGHQPRQFGPPVEPPSFPAIMVRICFDGDDLPYHAAIDAICLLGTLQSPSTIGPILKLVLDRQLHLDVLTFVPKKPSLTSSDNGYFDILPREAVLHIFCHLDFHSLVQCSQVSRLFRQITYDPLLYVRLDLKMLFHLVTSLTLKFLMPRCLLLRYFDFSWCGNYGKVTPVTLRTFLYARGGKLTNLILSNCHIFEPTVINAVGITCPLLVDLDLSNCHIIDTGRFAPLSNLNQLQQLNLYRTQVGNGELKKILASNYGLLSLNIGACSKVNGDDICQSLSNFCLQLTTLDLWRCQSLTSRGVNHLSTLRNLQDLDLGWCVNVLSSSGCIVTLVNSCANLERLLLSAHRQTSDVDIMAISTQLSRSLRQFSCMGSRNISAESIFSLASHCGLLDLLDISYCENLESRIFQRELCSLLPGCHVVTSLNGA